MSVSHTYAFENLLNWGKLHLPTETSEKEMLCNGKKTLKLQVLQAVYYYSVISSSYINQIIYKYIFTSTSSSSVLY